MLIKKSSKESASSLFNRYVWLVDTIYRLGRITFEQINEQWIRSELNCAGDDLPLKTFHNHRKAIEQMFDINIECDRKAGYIYYIENVDDLKRDGVRQWLLSTFSINNLINESHKLKHRILVENIPSGYRFLTQIIEAMRDGRTLEIVYQSFGRNEPHTFEAKPYCVKIFKQRWYMVAKSSDHDALRIYALDRMYTVSTNNETFDMPPDFYAENYFSGSFGIIDENIKEQKVVIRVFGHKVKYLNVLPLHHSQVESEKQDGYSTFEYFLRPTFDFRQELLSHADEIEVVSPEWFRNEIKSKILSVSKIYE